MSRATFQERAEEFNEKMGLAEPENGYWEDALIRFTVIGEEVGELLESVNKDRQDIGEELADIVITLYTGADTLNLELEGDFDVEGRPTYFDDSVRERASDIYEATAWIQRAVKSEDKELFREELMKSLYYCEEMANDLDIDLEKEVHEKMDYNMQKSGVKKHGKPVDDVDE